MSDNFVTDISMDNYLNSSNGYIEESEPEEDPNYIPSPPHDNSQEELAPPLDHTPENIPPLQGAYYDGPNIVPTAFPSMHITGFFINLTTGEHEPVHGRELPSPPPAIPDHDWSWIPDTLQEWRNEGKLPTVGEGSSVPIGPPYLGETPHYSIPPIVSHVSQQDNRIDLLEDAVNEMPGSDAYEHVESEMGRIGDRVALIVNAFENNADILESTREATLQLKARLDAADISYLKGQVRRLEQNLDGFQRRLEDMETSALGTRAFHAHMTQTWRDPYERQQ